MLFDIDVKYLLLIWSATPVPYIAPFIRDVLETGGVMLNTSDGVMMVKRNNLHHLNYYITKVANFTDAVNSNFRIVIAAETDVDTISEIGFLDNYNIMYIIYGPYIAIPNKLYFPCQYVNIYTGHETRLVDDHAEALETYCQQNNLIPLMIGDYMIHSELDKEASEIHYILLADELNVGIICKVDDTQQALKAIIHLPLLDFCKCSLCGVVNLPYRLEFIESNDITIVHAEFDC